MLYKKLLLVAVFLFTGQMAMAETFEHSLCQLIGMNGKNEIDLKMFEQKGNAATFSITGSCLEGFELLTINVGRACQIEFPQQRLHCHYRREQNGSVTGIESDVRYSLTIDHFEPITKYGPNGFSFEFSFAGHTEDYDDTDGKHWKNKQVDKPGRFKFAYVPLIRDDLGMNCSKDNVLLTDLVQSQPYEDLTYYSGRYKNKCGD